MQGPDVRLAFLPGVATRDASTVVISLLIVTQRLVSFEIFSPGLVDTMLSLTASGGTMPRAVRFGDEDKR